MLFYFNKKAFKYSKPIIWCKTIIQISYIKKRVSYFNMVEYNIKKERGFYDGKKNLF